MDPRIAALVVCMCALPTGELRATVAAVHIVGNGGFEWTLNTRDRENFTVTPLYNLPLDKTSISQSLWYPTSLVPAALDSFMAIATGSRSITFTWCPQSAESGATPIDYLLSCETDSCQTDSCGTDSCPPVNRSIIRGQSWMEYNCFTPNTTYTCYLSAMDDNGTVEPNETCTIQTLEDGKHI